jgi:hypothetical protein
MSLSENVKEFIDLKNSVQEKKISFLRFLATLVLSLIGLLTALHKTTGNSPLVRVSFALTIVLLASALLSLLITLYNLDIKGRKGLAENYRNELQSAYQQDRAMQPVYAGDDKRYEQYEKTSYILLVLSVFLLSAYAVLLAFS